MVSGSFLPSFEGQDKNIPDNMESQDKNGGGNKKGRPPKPLPKNSLGKRIRDRREGLGLGTEELGGFLGITNQQVSFAEISLGKVVAGTYKIGDKKKKKGFSDQLVIGIAQELGSDFKEPALQEHLLRWQERMLKLWFGGDNGQEDVSPINNEDNGGSGGTGSSKLKIVPPHQNSQPPAQSRPPRIGNVSTYDKDHKEGVEQPKEG